MVLSVARTGLSSVAGRHKGDHAVGMGVGATQATLVSTPHQNETKTKAPEHKLKLFPLDK